MCHSRLSTPIAEIQTSYPVWRARHLPFGNGVLSLPQRGSNVLEMYNLDRLEHPIADFTRTSLVKEYVWRVKGGADLSFGQLVDVIFISPYLLIIMHALLQTIGSFSLLHLQMIGRSSLNLSHLRFKRQATFLQSFNFLVPDEGNAQECGVRTWRTD